MQNIKTMLPYLLVNVLGFYLLPLAIQDTGTAMFLMLIGLPLVCLLTALLYGYRNGWHGAYAFLVALLFVPTLFIYYNSSAWVYLVGYGVLALLGNFLGKLFHKPTH